MDKIVQVGKFELSSGQISDYYYDFREIYTMPKHLKTLCQVKFDIDYNVVCAVPYGADGFATAYSLEHNIPKLTLRKERKTYGRENIIEGTYNNGARCLLFEDVITTGSSVEKAIDVLRQNNIEVVGVVCFANRNKIELDIPVFEIFHPTLLKFIKNSKLKNTRLIASHDEENLNITSDIVAVKVHCDLVSVEHLENLRNNIDLIIGDEKLCDIPIICIKKIHKYINFIDAVTVFPHHDIIKVFDKELPDLGLIVVLDMSTGNKLGDINEFIHYRNVIGFVSQYDHKCLKPIFTPGVRITKTTDNFGQNYKLPSQVSSQFIIVGRGLNDGTPIKKYNTIFNRSLMNASGCHSTTYEELDELFQYADYVVTKTCTLHKNIGNPKPWYYYDKEEKVSFNCNGLDNEGIQYYLDYYNSLQDHQKNRFILSIAGNYKELKSMISLCNENNIKIVELNISCPNKAININLDEIYPLKCKFNGKMGIKMPICDPETIQNICEYLTYYDYIVCSNTIPDTCEYLSTNKAGRGGARNIEFVRENIKEFYKYFAGDIVASGGVGTEPVDYFDHGATALAIGTQLIEHGPKIFIKTRNYY